MRARRRTSSSFPRTARPVTTTMPAASCSPASKTAAGCASASTGASRRWLAAGTVPGGTPAMRSMAQRALLDLHLSTRPDGAVVAGWYPGWDDAWPRDSSWVAVALAVSGHGADAHRVLAFLQREQNRDGTWAARYQPDGGGPVRDGRPVELDAVGWVPWAVWSWWEASHPPRSAPGRAVADGQRGRRRGRTVAGSGRPARRRHRLLGGRHAGDAGHRRSPADRPAGRGRHRRRPRPGPGGRRNGRPRRRGWPAPSRPSSAATASTGCRATPAGPDASVTFLGPPFGPGTAALDHAEDAAERTLTLPGGGVRPGADWPGNTAIAWTAETAFFALSDAATGEHGRASVLLSWLAAHRTPLGALPEQVTAAGQPASVAPLAWTDAAVLLALTAQARALPRRPGAAGRPGGPGWLPAAAPDRRRPLSGRGCGTGPRIAGRASAAAGLARRRAGPAGLLGPGSAG